MTKIVYWIDEELLAKAQEVAEEEGMDLSYGKIIIETVEEEEE